MSKETLYKVRVFILDKANKIIDRFVTEGVTEEYLHTDYSYASIMKSVKQVLIDEGFVNRAKMVHHCLIKYEKEATA